VDRVLAARCPIFETNRAMLRTEQNLSARSRKRGEAAIPRVGKRLPGFGIERAPSSLGVSAFDHQAAPAAVKFFFYSPLKHLAFYSKAVAWEITQYTEQT
jgi:hypothetical protein